MYRRNNKLHLSSLWQWLQFPQGNVRLGECSLAQHVCVAPAGVTTRIRPCPVHELCTHGTGWLFRCVHSSSTALIHCAIDLVVDLVATLFPLLYRAVPFTWAVHIQVAKKTVKVMVVGNPCNTNALICAANAPSIPKENFHALTRLDENRAKFQLANKAGVFFTAVQNVAVWGNHSTTQVHPRHLHNHTSLSLLSDLAI